MKPKAILIFVAMVLCAGGAAAQIDPSMHIWVLTSLPGAIRDTWASVHAEAAIENVVVEHWVVRSPDEQGFRFGNMRLGATAGRYASADDFLKQMWLLSVENDEQWFYARQTVLYLPLAKAASKPWTNEHRPIACSAVVDDTGRVVGWQVRTEAWSMYTDHWVLYPSYRAPSRNNTVSFVDTTGLGCVAPRELIVREFESARRSRQLGEYRYATATFALVPLEPTPAVEAEDVER